MNPDRIKKISKKLSYILRHHPESIGVELDKQGWANIQHLLEKLEQDNFLITLEELREVVISNDKKRFAMNEDGAKIRASQGHSIEIELGYEPQSPPEILYHGTSEAFLDSIRKTGLEKRSRHHVHLSSDKDTAIKVGMRHGKVVVLQVKAREMHQAGYKFFISENGVWLTEHVPTLYVIFGE